MSKNINTKSMFKTQQYTIYSKKNSQRAMQIQSSANLLQENSFNQQRGKSRYKSNRKTQEVSMEETDQAKDQGK